ncbi:MAG TPA: DNA repair protein RecO C-terminal domain-containing protein, partial [Gemmatimonadales bacterium]|nr:DNA repair protein RecO C-terminal domain-containing protein [Gemmatimonadales bacterium]
QPRVFQALRAGLDDIAASPESALARTVIAAVWWMVASLGFSPSVTACARDGQPLPDGPAPFSLSEGGLLCAACGRGARASVPAEDCDALRRFVQGDAALDLPLTSRRARAHRRLLVRFIRHHLAEGRDLAALTFWETMPWVSTS